MSSPEDPLLSEIRLPFRLPPPPPIPLALPSPLLSSLPLLTGKTKQSPPQHHGEYYEMYTTSKGSTKLLQFLSRNMRSSMRTSVYLRAQLVTRIKRHCGFDPGR